MRLRSMLFAVLAAAVLVTGRAAAQQADTTPGVLRLRQACAGRAVRVVTASGEMVRGRCGPVEDARLVVRDTAGRVWEMPYASIDRVLVRRSGARKGAIAGGLAGGILGGAWVGLIVNVLCNGDGGSGCGDDVVIGSLVGAGAGALTGAGAGAAIGSVMRVWVPVYP
ncbi:MAG TPA: hypothetical protein VK358_08180 [Longimicrobium sp.]|nr:hypothetical protein [Longimicrobium sp.]